MQNTDRPIGVGGEVPVGGGRSYDAFEELVASTGGRSWNAQFGAELDASFEKIVSEVQNRYLLMTQAVAKGRLRGLAGSWRKVVIAPAS